VAGIRSIITAIWLAVAVASPAAASDRARDRLTLLVGTGVVPDYEGSDDYTIVPGAAALLRFRGHNIVWRGTAVTFDLIPEHVDQKFKWQLGPAIGGRFDRRLVPGDPVVALLRRRKVAVEAGGFIGFTKTGVLTSAYDSLNVRVTAMADVGVVHRGVLVTTTVDYIAPLSVKTMVGVTGGIDFADANFARYYFGVGPRASAASGLPQYRPGGGLKSAQIGLIGATTIVGSLRKGLLVGALANYSRLRGGFAASPVVATRGSRNQFSLVAGLAYTF